MFVTYAVGRYSGPTLAWLETAAEGAGWYHSRTESDPSVNKVFYEPKRAPAAVPRPTELFHVTRSEYAEDIARNGVHLQEHGRTWQRRAYFTPRAFFATSLDDAVEFIRSMEGGGPATSNRVPLTAEILSTWEVFCVDPGERSYYQDVEFTAALWTDEPVGVESVSVCKGWRSGRS